jgi:hypothetical protein
MTYPADQFVALDKVQQDAAEYVACLQECVACQKRAFAALSRLGESLGAAGDLLLTRKAAGNASDDAIAMFVRAAQAVDAMRASHRRYPEIEAPHAAH